MGWGRGNYYAGEIVIQILLDDERYEDLRRILNDYLADAHFNEQAWDQIGRQLLLENQYELAVRVFRSLGPALLATPSVRLCLLRRSR
mgnify:CR=1 FL=1